MPTSEALALPELAPLSSYAYWRRQLTWMVAIGFALRVGFVLAAHTYRFKSVGEHFGYGFEMGRIAESLATGHGFGNPFTGLTGPTAWEPPLYPFLIAGVFKLAGVYSATASIILLTINSSFSALTAIPVFYLAKRAFGVFVARWSALIWTTFPYAMYWAVKWIWETSISAFLLATLLLMTWRLTERRRQGEWAAWGLLWGVAALLNPSLLSVLPFAGSWVVYKRWRAGELVIGRVLLAASLFVAVIAPWLVRNYRAFHQIVFIRTNFGAELRFGNGPGAAGLSMGYELHPSQSPLAFSQYSGLGELAYVAHQKREAIEWIRRNPAEFLRTSLLRFVYYWSDVPWTGIMPEKNALFIGSSIGAFCGLWLMRKQRRPGYFLFALCIIVFPLIYYFVFPHPRYRASIEPEMYILIVFVISQAREFSTRATARSREACSVHPVSLPSEAAPLSS